ncbi:MAG: transglutaminase domain-containing protein [Proteobacteria bacterium]|nr:transglutaminase domain-containing protein [Pseudomonadota bacterium]MDA1301895.1 transglutaminase domain-containing protein [Pseudomonadota bacterium]
MIRIVVLMLAAGLATGVLASPERRGEVALTVSVDAPKDSTDVRVWIPYPVSDDNQDISRVRIEGDFTASGVYREKQTGNLALYAEWTKPSDHRTLALVFDVTAREAVNSPDAPEQAIPVEIQRYLQGTELIPTDGKVREVAESIVSANDSVSEKGRKVYQWVVENTVRDPQVQGCGTGDVEVMLSKRAGKCADISSVFVALARAAGVPAREVFGLRLGKEDVADMTGGHHCWAEFYVPGSGWVPADPADVRKLMLVEGLELDEADNYQDYYFGKVDQYRIALARGGRGYYLNPPQADGPLNYFMYPYAEVDGRALEWLAAQQDLKYSVSFRAL